MSSEIGSKAKIPNPALRPLGKVVGDWVTTGTHPMVPDTPLHGRASFAWQDGGAFLVWRSELDDKRFPNGISIFGSDDVAGIVFVSYFDERGISRKYDVTFAEDGFAMHRDDPNLAQRMTFKLDPDAQRMTCEGRMSRDGGEWEDDLSLIFDRK